MIIHPLVACNLRCNQRNMLKGWIHLCNLSMYVFACVSVFVWSMGFVFENCETFTNIGLSKFIVNISINIMSLRKCFQFIWCNRMPLINYLHSEKTLSASLSLSYTQKSLCHTKMHTALNRLNAIILVLRPH